jgi:orotidine-5'-phosphate decarboxylase
MGGQELCLNFRDRLVAISEQNHSHLCVGLDPVRDRIPVDNLVDWARSIIATTADLVCCYKPNSAFYEALGPAGWEFLAETIAAVPKEIPVLLDAKRGDIGNTAAAYASAAFDVLGAGAVTVSPYLGEDSLDPFLAYTDKAVFVLCRTSNPGAGDVQDLLIQDERGSHPLYEIIAERCRTWNRNGNIGLVAGATYPDELRRIRSICPDQMLLVPGVGSQGGDLQAAVRAARDRDGGGFLVNVSRQVIFASSREDFARAARRAADELRLEIESARDGAA